MSLRKVSLGILLSTLLLVNSQLSADDTMSAVTIGVQARDGVSSVRPGAKSAVSKNAGEPLDSLLNQLVNNKEFLIYGGIASFGILMMGLAIGSASSSPNKGADAQLELLKQEKEKAENLARLKAEFLNQVSHELRTPLAVIIGYIECITDGLYGQIESKHQEILQVVAKQSSHLKNMIDQILIYSRLEAGKQPVRIEELQLSKIISEMKDTFDFLCRQKGIEMRWEIPADPLVIRSDLTRVKEIVSNLIQNAVKYTDRGSITLRASKVQAAGSMTIEVQDTGMGISENHLASIFEPFMQAHKTSSENSRGGIGLGLSIVKKHLEQIRGTITVESELGKGSIFRVTLPKNYEKSRSRAHRFLGFFKLNPSHKRQTQPTYAGQHSDSARQKTPNTSHAIS